MVIVRVDRQAGRWLGRYVLYVGKIDGWMEGQASGRMGG